MAGKGYWGGGARKLIYRIKDDHSGLVQLDGVTEATLLAHASLYLKDDDEHIIEASDITYDDAGNPTFKITHSKIDAIYTAFEEVAAPKKTSSGSSAVKNAKTSEAGRQIGGASASGGVNFVVIDLGPDNGTDRLCHVMVGTFKKTSGGVGFKAGDLVMTTLEFIGMPAKAAISIIAALFDSAAVDVAEPKVLPLDWPIKRLFLDLPA